MSKTEPEGSLESDDVVNCVGKTKDFFLMNPPDLGPCVDIKIERNNNNNNS